MLSVKSTSIVSTENPYGVDNPVKNGIVNSILFKKYGIHN